MKAPNPALHLTPPSDSGHIAHRVRAVQVISLFGGQRGMTRDCVCGRLVVRAT